MKKKKRHIERMKRKKKERVDGQKKNADIS